MIAQGIFHTFNADVRERLRRPAFLVVMALTALASYAFAPPTDAPYTIIDLNGFRGVYNAAWLGAMLTMLVTQFIGLLGFYYVRGAIAFDISSGVGQILGATQLSRPAYLIGKWLSNWAILSLITAIVGVMGILLLLGRGEDRSLDLAGLLMPLLVIALPTMGMVAGMALLFDAVRLLRGTLGSVVYFILFLGGMIGGMVLATDPAGLAILTPSITQACSTVYGPACAQQMSVGLIGIEQPLQTFVWPGLAWSLSVIAGQWLWAGIGLVLVLLSGALFRGFVAEPVRPRRADSPGRPEETSDRAKQPITLSPVQASRNTFTRLLLAELRLALKGRPWWWYVAAIGLVVACVISPTAVTRQWLLPLAWIWPLLVWSELGTRERRYGTAPLLWSAPQPALRQLPATWLASTIITLMLGLGALINLAVAGDTLGLIGIGVTAACIPALALTLGRWSNSPRLFEIVYLLLWYGALNSIPGLALAPDSLDQIIARVFLTIGLLALAVVRPRR